MSTEIGHYLREIDTARQAQLRSLSAATSNALPSSASSPSSECLDHYQKAFVSAVEEFRLITECLDKVRQMSRKRRHEAQENNRHRLKQSGLHSSNAPSTAPSSALSPLPAALSASHQHQPGPDHCSNGSGDASMLGGVLSISASEDRNKIKIKKIKMVPSTSNPEELTTTATSASSHSHTYQPLQHGTASASVGSAHNTSVTSSNKSSKPVNIWKHENTILPPDLEVAVLMEADSDPQTWAWAKIVHYTGSPSPRYYVKDLDQGDDDRPKDKRFWIDAKHVLPLYSLEEVPLSKRKEFKPNSQVLALFPVDGVTTFYKATVVVGPKKTKSTKYQLKFEDDNELVRLVDARYVTPHPGHIKTASNS